MNLHEVEERCGSARNEMIGNGLLRENAFIAITDLPEAIRLLREAMRLLDAAKTSVLNAAWHDAHNHLGTEVQD